MKRVRGYFHIRFERRETVQIRLRYCLVWLLKEFASISRVRRDVTNSNALSVQVVSIMQSVSTNSATVAQPIISITING